MIARKGNLIDAFERGEVDVIVHGCNCFNTMGAGIAKEIKSRIPEAYAADKATRYGDMNKLGTIGVVFIGGGKIVVNAYTQYGYVGKSTLVDYEALRLCFKKINNHPNMIGKYVGFPKIGCGLAGGSWEVVKKIIDEELPNGILYVL